MKNLKMILVGVVLIIGVGSVNSAMAHGGGQHFSPHPPNFVSILIHSADLHWFSMHQPRRHDPAPRHHKSNKHQGKSNSGHGKHNGHKGGQHNKW